MRVSPGNRTPGYPLVPEQYRCIWMTAGILSYQLCGRQFDCDRCPLDAAMRMQFSPGGQGKAENPAAAPPAPGAASPATGEDSSPAGPREAFSPLRSPQRHLPASRFYSRNHFWAERVEERVLRVGLEPGYASLLAGAKAVALPSAGQTVRPGQVCCWIVLEGGTIPLASPVAGRVSDLNGKVTEQPHEISSHPFTTGWLFEVDIPAASAVRTLPPGEGQEKLLTREQVDQTYRADAGRFNEIVAAALHGGPPHPLAAAEGDMMQDGGQMLQDVQAMLGPKRYFEIVREVYGMRMPS